MEKTGNRQVRRSTLLTLVYCLLISLMGACTMQPATPEDVAQAELDQVRQTEYNTVSVSTQPAGHATQAVAPSDVLTTPSLPLPNSIADRCVCAWGTWSSEGLMCAGVRCNSHCSNATRACVERHACVLAGI